MKKIQGSILLYLIIAIFITGCQPGKIGPEISVEEAWGRSAPAVATMAAFYMVIRNTGSEPDMLISAKSPACGKVELHETTMEEDGTMGMEMVHEKSIEITPGSSVELEVGGLHAMCVDKQADFKAGDRYDLTLVFQRSGEVSVQVDIRDE